MIDTIKSTLRTEIAKDDPKLKQLRIKQARIYSLEAPQLFPLSAKEQKDMNKEISKLKIETQRIEQHFEEVRTNRIYMSAFEWRFEFPEVLNDDGEFIGFDCIIGNPPYIQLQKMGADADALLSMGYKTFVRTGDIYCLFYELGMSILKQGCLLNFIISNKWMRAGYGSEMRRYCVENSNPVQLIDFSGFKVFDTATVDVNIIMSEKAAYQNNTLCCVVDKQTFRTEKMSDYCRENLMQNKFTPDSWVVLSPIEQRIKDKIERAGTPLKDWDIQINYGIKTGYNEAFIIDRDTKDALIAKSPKNAELIRPILRGRDIKRYKADFADLWILNVHNGTKTTPPINIDDYPDIKSHLDQFYPALEKRA